MPRLLFFAACQKAIINKTDETVSMITLLNTLRFQVEEESVVPADALALFAWGAVAAWERMPGDEDKTFAQRVQVILPNGEPLGSSHIPRFAFKERTYLNVINGQGFPFQTGMYHLRLEVQEVGEDTWHLAAEFPLEIIYVPLEAPAADNP